MAGGGLAEQINWPAKTCFKASNKINACECIAWTEDKRGTKDLALMDRSCLCMLEV